DASIFLNELGYATRIHLVGKFVTKDLPQPWQTLRKIFARFLTTRVTGGDQPSFQIMQMLYYFINSVHVDYDALIWERLHYSYLHPTTVIPYPRHSRLSLPKEQLRHLAAHRPPNPVAHQVADIDVTNLDEATQMSLNTARSIDDFEISKLSRKLMRNWLEIEKIVKRNDDVDENQFVDEILNRQEDPNTRIEPGSHKERPKVEKMLS
nr:hypothetical protein [Tanacetum cinerariifolium]